MILILDRNFDPSSFKFTVNDYIDINEFKTVYSAKDVKGSINNTLLTKSDDFNIKNIVLNFNTNGSHSRVSITDKYISFINTLKRTDHENIKGLLSSFITCLLLFLFVVHADCFVFVG
jgi:hypothetical protein